MVIHQTILVAVGEISLCVPVLFQYRQPLGNGIRPNESKKHSMAILYYCTNKLHYNANRKTTLNTMWLQN